jgi:fatty acid desaturase
MSADSHEHDYARGVPDRLPAALVRELSRIEPSRALLAVASEWLGIATGIALYMWRPGVWTLLPVVIWIGARQHALAIIAHDASHYRFLRQRWANDLFGNLLLAWPVFISVAGTAKGGECPKTAGFRHFHGAHHKHFDEVGDGNRALWRTHDADGRLQPEWVYPKTRLGLALVLLRRGLLATGVRWIVRGVLSVLVIKEPGWARLCRVVCYAGLATWLTASGHWREFMLLWVLPLCTWHVVVQYMRLIAEHSAVRSHDLEFQGTRTTLATPLERLLMLPRNVGYHLEHHWYPSVPCYRLPELHAALMATPRFAAAADISPSLLHSLASVTRLS